MSRLDSKIVDGLRDIYGYHDRFDVFLACAFEPKEKGPEKFDFYEKIGEVIKKLGKGPYLPHKEIDLNWPNEKIYDIPNEIVIPCSDIVISYLGLQSITAGIMVENAFEKKIPVSYLYEKEVGLDPLKYRSEEFILTKEGVQQIKTKIIDPGWRGDIYDLIEFENEEKALEKLKLSLEAFYKQKIA